MSETRFFSKSPPCRPGGERFVRVQDFSDVIEVPILGMVSCKLFLKFLQSFEQHDVDHLDQFEQQKILEKFGRETVYRRGGGIRGGNG
jgi:hypothetical protein